MLPVMLVAFSQTFWGVQSRAMSIGGGSLMTGFSSTVISYSYLSSTSPAVHHGSLNPPVPSFSSVFRRIFMVT